jgi:2-haloacid dehalogenase
MITELKDVKVCVFDAYGTLFDVHSAVGQHVQSLGSQANSISMLWRQKQLEYTWLRSLMGRYVDFQQVTAEALSYALQAHSVVDEALEQRLLLAYNQLSSYPEVIDTLQKMRKAGISTAILSNGSPQMLQAAVAYAGISDLIDQVISVDDLSIYKPDPRVYQLAVDGFGVTKEQILFHSSNAWDVAGAVNFGFNVAWINRFSQPREALSKPPNLELKDLSHVLSALNI